MEREKTHTHTCSLSCSLSLSNLGELRVDDTSQDIFLGARISTVLTICVAALEGHAVAVCVCVCCVCVFKIHLKTHL
jgi:hypothetical protein